MNKSMLILIIIAVVAIPIAYTMGKGSATRDLQEHFDLTIEEIQTTHDVYLETMESELAAAKSQWDLRYEQHRSQQHCETHSKAHHGRSEDYRA